VAKALCDDILEPATYAINEKNKLLLHPHIDLGINMGRGLIFMLLKDIVLRLCMVIDCSVLEGGDYEKVKRRLQRM